METVFLLLLLLNRLPPDITGGQGLNGFKELLFFTILQKNLIGEKWYHSGRTICVTSLPSNFWISNFCFYQKCLCWE
jgi:hypothetical protein